MLTKMTLMVPIGSRLLQVNMTKRYLIISNMLLCLKKCAKHAMNKSRILLT